MKSNPKIQRPPIHGLILWKPCLLFEEHMFQWTVGFSCYMSLSEKCICWHYLFLTCPGCLFWEKKKMGWLLDYNLVLILLPILPLLSTDHDFEQVIQIPSPSGYQSSNETDTVAAPASSLVHSEAMIHHRHGLGFGPHHLTLLPALQETHETCGFDLWVWKIPWEREWQKSLVSCSPWGHKESDMTEGTEHACTHLMFSRFYSLTTSLSLCQVCTWSNLRHLLPLYLSNHGSNHVSYCKDLMIIFLQHFLADHRINIKLLVWLSRSPNLHSYPPLGPPGPSAFSQFLYFRTFVQAIPSVCKALLHLTPPAFSLPSL